MRKEMSRCIWLEGKENEHGFQSYAPFGRMFIYLNTKVSWFRFIRALPICWMFICLDFESTQSFDPIFIFIIRIVY